MFADLKPLVPYLKRYRRGLFWGGVSVVLSNAIWILLPQVLRAAVDALNHGVTRQKILYYAGLIVAVSLSKGIFLFLTRWILIGISRDIEFDLRNDLFRQLERQSAGYYAEHRTGDIMARMTNDLNAVRQLLGPAIMYSANTVLFTIGAVFFLLRISPFLTLVALVPLPLASVLVQTLGARFRSASNASRRCSRRFPRRSRRTSPARGWCGPSRRRRRRSPPSRRRTGRMCGADCGWCS